jgi:hypothetical protein
LKNPFSGRGWDCPAGYGIQLSFQIRGGGHFDLR